MLPAADMNDLLFADTPRPALLLYVLPPGPIPKPDGSNDKTVTSDKKLTIIGHINR